MWGWLTQRQKNNIFAAISEYGLCVLTNWLLPDFYLSHILVLKGKRWFWDDRLTICLNLPQRHFWALSDVLLFCAIATRVFHYSDLKQENQHESKEAKRSILPRLPQPYALLPTTTPRKPKTQYEALACKRRTDQGTKELPPKRSTPGVFCLPTLQAFQTDLGSVDRKPIDQLTRHWRLRKLSWKGVSELILRWRKRKVKSRRTEIFRKT